MLEKSENTKLAESLSTSSSIDVEKQVDVVGAKSNTLCSENVANNNNHFFDENVKERAPPGINGSLVFLYALFLSVFTIGWININRCPLNRIIPIYLILAGFLGAVAKFLSKYENKYCFWTTVSLILIDAVWHGVGTFVVYKEYQPSYDPKDVVYCNRTTYLVAFWTLTLEYTLLVMFLLLSCCYMLMRKDFRTESGTK